MNKWLKGNGLWCATCKGTGRGKLSDIIEYQSGAECRFYHPCPACDGERRIDASSIECRTSPAREREMSQRDSGYARKERDLYETPEWVTAELLTYIPGRVNSIWEPACASGKMARVLSEGTAWLVRTSDIDSGIDFLTMDDSGDADAIITNPPYEHAVDFIWHAISLMERKRGFVAMLLRTDFDHAMTRRGMFRYSPQFARKLVLMKRIRWFEDSKGSPSFNHAWFMWDWEHQGMPSLAYGP